MHTLRQYIPYIGILALIIFAVVVVFYQSLVDTNFQRISLGSFLTNPGYYYSQAKKDVPKFTFTPVASQPNNDRIEKHCENNGCLIVLRYGDETISEEMIHEHFSNGTKPVHVADPASGKPIAWVVPAISADEPGEIASDIGAVVWDAVRSIVIYEVFPQEEIKQRRRVIVWDYTQDWSFGNLQRVNTNLPAELITWTDYDQTNGYLQFAHFDRETGEQVRTSQLSATRPVLYSE